MEENRNSILPLQMTLCSPAVNGHVILPSAGIIDSCRPARPHLINLFIESKLPRLTLDLSPSGFSLQNSWPGSLAWF